MNIILLSAFQLFVSQPADEVFEIQDSIEASGLHAGEAYCHYEWSLSKAGKSCVIRCDGYICNAKPDGDFTIPWSLCNPGYGFIAVCEFPGDGLNYTLC